ncbi:MAG: hypothetical protein H6Q90_2216 [Deltaproteobacteria bacterium]|nr:hypothetical protein [Deltaproteobacteria bacterium]
MIKLLIYLALAAGLVWCGSTVKLGKRTFFGHVQAIWKTEEMQELKEGVRETAGPTADKVKRGVEAGLAAATKEGSGSGSAGSAGSGSATVPASP